MLKLLLLIAVPFMVYAEESCPDLFANRGSGLVNSQQAFTCYQASITPTSSRRDVTHALNQMAYLKFFIAENFMKEKEDTLLESINISEKALSKFGPKYNLVEYRKLSDEERKVVAEALYTYGLTVARYVDVKGFLEALKRMDDIKKSMLTIIRLKEEATAFYGAHRVLGIFHMKVPAIAGGDIEISKEYLPKAVQSTLFSGELSRYPLNNTVYADLLYKLGKTQESCHQLRLVAALTDEEVSNLDNGLLFETLGNVRDAKVKMINHKCAN